MLLKWTGEYEARGLAHSPRNLSGGNDEAAPRCESCVLFTKKLTASHTYCCILGAAYLLQTETLIEQRFSKQTVAETGSRQGS